MSHDTPRLVDPEQVRSAWLTGSEVALLDLRGEATHATGHPLFAASFPLDRLEVEALDRLPRRDVPLVLVGEGNDPATGEARLRGLGYTDIGVLDGGLDGWVASGGELFADVNSPSKAFGELVAERAGTPLLPAAELRARLDAGDDVVVVDARRFTEFQVMSIPTATSVPGAELVARVARLAPDPATTVVVNCAGRTRSIIGAQSLIDAGLPNPVVALRDGTIGWTLAGLALEHGQSRRFDPDRHRPDEAARSAARRVADAAGVRRVAPTDVADLDEAGRHTTYCFDVRTPEEHRSSHPSGFRSAPGGQLVQETDAFAPVRGARIVLFDDLGVRADMTASWLAQMGWDVAVVDPPTWPADDLVEGGADPPRSGVPVVPGVSPTELAGWLGTAAPPVVVDLSRSTAYRRAHVPGAAWASRRDLARLAGTGAGRAVLVSEDGDLAAFAAAELAAVTDGRVSPAMLVGGMAGWLAADLPAAGGDDEAWWSTPHDVYRRPYEGVDVDHVAMEAYLAWEHGLVAQLARDGTHRFRVLGAGGSRGRPR